MAPKKNPKQGLATAGQAKNSQYMSRIEYRIFYPMKT
jgi:hypothetical protein